MAATTFTEVLPPTRTSPHRAITWHPCPPEAGCPCVGVLTVANGGRACTAYAVEEIYPGPGFGAGRAFRLTKSDGTVYHCFLGHDRMTCDCAGKSYEATEKADRREHVRGESLGCRHLDSLAAVIHNGWLPRADANPDVDVGPTETTDQELPECFRGVPGSAEGVPF